MNYESFLLQNPWRKGNDFKINSVQRETLPIILKELDDPSITVIIGGRQVGKTTILMNLISYLLRKKVAPKAIFYFNLDDFNLHPYFENYTRFINFINSEYEGFKFVLIDEIQRIKNPGIFLKLIYDLKLELKIIVSGSSSLELKSKIQETLTGRKHTFEILPFSFNEFLIAKNILEIKEKSIDDLLLYHKDQLKNLLKEFILYGGYPKVVLTENKERKLLELKEIYDSYIRKDVKDFLNVENISGYNNLVRGIAFQIGNLINYNELSSLSGLNVLTVKKYIDYLEGTYIFKRVFPYFKNARKEVSKTPKIFAYDTGLINYITGNLRDEANLSGNIYENFVFTELLKKGCEIKFWRSGGGAEVDFIVNNIPVEVKSSNLKKMSLTKSFISFLKKYQPEKAYFLNMNLYGERIFNKTKIYFYPLYVLYKIIDEFC